MVGTLETSKFGNGTLVGSGGNVTTNVHNTFGARDTGGSVGVLDVEGAIEQMRLVITGDNLNDLTSPLVDTYLPAGAIIRDVYSNVATVFALSGTTPTILIGTATSEVTNGLVISQTVAQALGAARLTTTLTGTWAVNTPLAARTKIGIVLGGTLPVATRAGKVIVTIEYIRPAVTVDG